MKNPHFLYSVLFFPKKFWKFEQFTLAAPLEDGWYGNIIRYLLPFDLQKLSNFDWKMKVHYRLQ